MGTITISIDDETERTFRERVKAVLGERKGALGQAVTEALGLWIREKTQDEIARSALAQMEKPYRLGERKYRSRDEIHGRDTPSR